MLILFFLLETKILLMERLNCSAPAGMTIYIRISIFVFCGVLI